MYYNLALSKHDLKASATFFLKICMRPWIRRLRFFYQSLPPEGDLATKLYTSDKENNNDNNKKIIFRFKILLIDYLNELIDFSMSFPFYRRLNPLFDELFNTDTTLSSSRSISCARAGWGPPARGDPRARKNASTN